MSDKKIFVCSRALALNYRSCSSPTTSFNYNYSTGHDIISQSSQVIKKSTPNSSAQAKFNESIPLILIFTSMSSALVSKFSFRFWKDLASRKTLSTKTFRSLYRLLLVSATKASDETIYTVLFSINKKHQSH